MSSFGGFLANRQHALEACDKKQVPFYGDLPIKVHVRIIRHTSNRTAPDLSQISWWITKLLQDRLWTGRPNMKALVVDQLMTGDPDRMGIRIVIERTEDGNTDERR